MTLRPPEYGTGLPVAMQEVRWTTLFTVLARRWI